MISFFPFLQNRGKQGQDLSKNYVTILFFILMHENILNFSERPKSIFGPNHELCKTIISSAHLCTSHCFLVSAQNEII